MLEVFDAIDIKSNLGCFTCRKSGHMVAGGRFVMYAFLGNENVKFYDGSMHLWTAEKDLSLKLKSNSLDF